MLMVRSMVMDISVSLSPARPGYAKSYLELES